MPMIGVLGKVEVVARDAGTGRVVKKVVARNTVTNALIAELIKAVQSGKNNFLFTAVRDETRYEFRRYWYLALGTGTGTPARVDTALFAEVPTTRKAGSVYLPAYNQLQYYVRYMPEEANGYTYTELGVFENTNSDLTGGTLFNHLLISPPLSKTPDILVDFYVTITFG